MAHARTIPAPSSVFEPAAPAAEHSWRTVFRRALDAVINAQQRRVEREIERYLRTVGGSLTDEVEREIERRFLR